jgi:hypothetical protein
MLTTQRSTPTYFFGTGPRWYQKTLKDVPNLPHRSEKMLLSVTAQQHNRSTLKPGNTHGLGVHGTEISVR